MKDEQVCRRRDIHLIWVPSCTLKVGKLQADGSPVEVR